MLRVLNTSRLEAHAGFFTLLMKVIFLLDVLWPFDKKLISWLVKFVRTRDYTVTKYILQIPFKKFGLPSTLRHICTYEHIFFTITCHCLTYQNYQRLQNSGFQSQFSIFWKFKKNIEQYHFRCAQFLPTVLIILIGLTTWPHLMHMWFIVLSEQKILKGIYWISLLCLYFYKCILCTMSDF